MDGHFGAVRFGVHSGQVYSRFDDCLALWQRAEALGYDWISAFDHFRPGPAVPCFEGTTLLAAMAAHTRRVRCAMLVLAVPQRHPAVVAHIASTIDHISGGRVELGIGAAGPDLAYSQYAIAFPPLAVRMQMLDEACHIVRSLWTRDKTTFEGRHYTLTDAQLEPKPIQARLPIVIGGGGEQRTLQIAAKHADVWNVLAPDVDVYARKARALEAHCAAAGRDPATIRRSLLLRAVLADDERDAQARRRELYGDGPVEGLVAVGTPAQCAERLQPYAALGVRDFLIGIRPPIDWQSLELFATAVAPALGAQSA